MLQFIRKAIQNLSRPNREVVSTPAAPSFEWSDALLDALGKHVSASVWWADNHGWTLEAVEANADAMPNPTDWLAMLYEAEVTRDACKAHYDDLHGQWGAYWDTYTAALANIASAVLALGILYARHQEAAQAA
jgi:hypothetical protein